LTDATPLQVGDNTIVASIADRAGNKTITSTTFLVQITPPAKVTLPEGQLSSFDLPGDPELSIEIRALVLDANGKGVPGVAVLFTIVTGTGSVGSLSTTKVSDLNGLATAVYQPDNQAGETVIEMRLPQYPQIAPQTVTITKTYFIKPVIAIYSGNNQTGIIGRCLKEPLKVKVMDANHENAAIGGLEVEFEVIAGNGILVEGQGTKPISGVDGIAGIHLILGRTADQEVKVRARILLRNDQEVVFTAVGKLPKIKIIQGQ
jgi:hypothetical protein